MLLVQFPFERALFRLAILKSDLHLRSSQTFFKTERGLFNGMVRRLYPGSS
jgi:hypothetical protein